eukprot:Skav221106  [mRNA]  locus=scaffold233:24911:30088:+ [translate_table: standard]
MACGRLARQAVAKRLLGFAADGCAGESRWPAVVLFVVSEYCRRVCSGTRWNCHGAWPSSTTDRCRRRQLLRDPRDWVAGAIAPVVCRGAPKKVTKWAVPQVAMTSLGHVHLWTESLDLLEACGAAVSACERQRAWQQALQVFASMQGKDIAGDVMRLKRSLASYGTVISACGNALQWKESVELLNALQQQGLQPSLIIMNLCLNACRKAEKLHVSLQLYNDMLSRSERPDLLSYTSLISVCGLAVLTQQEPTQHRVSEDRHHSGLILAEV